MEFAWPSGTGSDPWLAAALWSALGAWGTAFALVLWIALLRVWARVRGAAVERRLSRWRPILAAVVANDSVPPRAPAAREIRDVLAVWNQQAVAIKGPARARLADWARQHRLGEHARELLDGRAVRDRLLGLATLGHLADPSHFAAVRACAAMEDSLVSLAAARALIAMDAAEAFVALRAELVAREDWPLARLLAAFREHRSDRLPGLVANAIDLASDAELARLLQLAQAVPPERVALQARRVLKRGASSEALVAALRLLSDPRDSEFARRYAKHEDWVVRLAAVRALGRMAAKDDLPVLCAALADPVWWVRHRAADAIVALPYLSTAQLRRLREIVDDRFGADALARAIAEKRPG